MRRLTVLIAAALALALLAGCTPGMVFTSPADEEFQESWEESWEESMEELREDAASGEKDHRWRVLDAAGEELFTVADQETVKLLDDLLSDGGWEDTDKDPGAPACSYVYSQEKTLLAGQDPDAEREYQDLVTFTVSSSEDVVTVQILDILEDMDLPEGLSDLLTFTCAIPAEKAEALRDPSQFGESE